jgi:plastocyanin
VTEIDHQHDLNTAAQPTGATWRRRICLGIAGVLAVATLAACGTSSSSKATEPTTASSRAGSATSSAAGSSQPAAQPAVITIDKFAYQLPASVSPGATVMVQNKDRENHTVTADSADAFDVKVDADASVSFTAPTKPGSYPLHCIYHSNMHGTLVVK